VSRSRPRGPRADRRRVGRRLDADPPVGRVERDARDLRQQRLARARRERTAEGRLEATAPDLDLAALARRDRGVEARSPEALDHGRAARRGARPRVCDAGGRGAVARHPRGVLGEARPADVDALDHRDLPGLDARARSPPPARCGTG
jgi:hypothetical protein